MTECIHSILRDGILFFLSVTSDCYFSHAFKEVISAFYKTAAVIFPFGHASSIHTLDTSQFKGSVGWYDPELFVPQPGPTAEPFPDIDPLKASKILCHQVFDLNGMSRSGM